ncbi:YqgE/AlgH family protein [Aestuariivita sp.]|jgi:putative transcriptional regulator|uniref:YqgE/AlgH family protein n=1 Tax=Aestuariivita sp. TaxID=1872407 RepID=UPI00216CAD7B|nr:YqgE/AlgH family protein [Aestuariivita sp.]MCE8009206.1 YqgE/AlgH family protein [Aestuariivita sp.]
MLDLTGKLLIAMPGMGDPRFEASVVFVCSHSGEGAMGLIINKPAPEVRLAELLEQLDIDPRAEGLNRPVHFGGPVEGGRGFVLHGRDYGSSIQTLEVTDEIGMTATLDVLEDIARGTGPSQALMLLGYAGWGAGQLEGEIGRNGWLTADASADLIFGLPDERKWSAALKTLGIEPMMLSGSAGHA